MIHVENTQKVSYLVLLSASNLNSHAGVFLLSSSSLSCGLKSANVRSRLKFIPWLSFVIGEYKALSNAQKILVKCGKPSPRHIVL